MDFFTALKQNINEYIVANGNKEITADILRPILLEICNITFAKMGDLELLQTVYKNDLVGAINEALNAESGVKIHYGTFPDPNDATITNFELGDFYAQQGDTGIDSFWQYNGQSWVKIADADSQSGVQSVTGDGVDNTDPENPVLTFPTPAEIGAIEDAPSDGKVYGRKDAVWEEVKEFQGVETADTADIKLLGDGTVGDALKAELADMPNAEDIFGRMADGWQPIIRKRENTEFRWIEIVDAAGFALLTYVYEYYDANSDTWKQSRKVLSGVGYSGGVLGSGKTDIIAIGQNAARGSKGIDINALGYQAALSSEGSSINAFGYNAALNSKGININAFGSHAAQYSEGSTINALGYQAALSSEGSSINAFGYNAARDSKGRDINAFGSQAARDSEGSNINAFGNQAARDSKGRDINAFGYLAAQDSKGININVFGQNSYNQGQDFNYVNIFGPNLQPTKSNQNIIGGEEFLMPGSTPQTILGAGDKSIVTVETVKSMINITPSVIALMHGEAEEDIYPVFPNLQWDITIQSIVLVSRDAVTGSNLEARILINDTPQQGVDLIIPANSRESNEVNLIDWDAGQNIDLEVTQVGSTDAGSNLALYIFYSLRS